MTSGEHQMIILAIAELALSRPSFDNALGQLADKLGAHKMYEDFKQSNGDRIRSERGLGPRIPPKPVLLLTDIIPPIELDRQLTESNEGILEPHTTEAVIPYRDILMALAREIPNKFPPEAFAATMAIIQAMQRVLNQKAEGMNEDGSVKKSN